MAPGAQSPLGFTRTLLAAFLILLGVASFVWVVYANTRTLAEDTTALEHSWNVIGELEATLSDVKDAETGQRGYLLTNDRAYLEPYNEALSAIRVHFTRLRSLAANDLAQQRRLTGFEDLVQSKLKELADTIRLFAEGDTTVALRTVRAGFGREAMDRIRDAVSTMRGEELTRLSARSRRASTASTRVVTAAIVGGLSFLVLFAGFLAVVRMDLLGRARSQAALRESDERLRTTLHSIGDAVLATDGAGLVTFLNPVAERLTGWPSDDALGRSVEEVFRIENETTRAPVESPVRRVIREGIVVGLANHTVLISRSAEEIPIADSGAPIRDAQGAIAGVVLVFRDITEHREAERDTQRLAAIVSSSEVAIVGETVDNVITDWNPGAEALFGFTAAEMIGSRMALLAPPDAPDPSSALTAELLAERRVAEFDARRRTRDGRWLEVVVNLSPIRDEHGQVIGISRLIRDVTERRKQARELDAARMRAEEANAAKDRFLATLSHELRTPLTPVMASVHRLERRPDLGEGIAESLAMIRRNVELEARLIDDLLDLTRIAKGKVELDRAPLDLHVVLASVVQSSRSEFFNKGVALDAELGATEHYCTGDAARLQQIFWNILKNAAKFTPAGGHVTVRSQNPGGGRIRVIVSDTGRGIRPDVLPRIFEAFEQGDVTAARRAGGLGLGLAIAKSLVELHGGAISAASAGEDQGASFAVDLATTTERPLPMPLPPSEEKQFAARRNTSVLIVEDDVDTGDAMRHLLSEAGFEVRAADSVAAALGAFRERPADILVTDVGLPDGSGLDLLGSLRALHPDLRGIVLSGYGMEDDLDRSRALGFSEHFVKPLNLSRLIAAIDRLGVRAG